MIDLLVATQNPGKLKEYRDLLHSLNAVRWLSLRDVQLDHMHVEEHGTTFEENARIKAAAYGQASGLLTLADDSGLVVDALDGAPGVYSARYGAPEVTTEIGRYELLLKNLSGIEADQRLAHFVCVVAIYAPNQPIKVAYGKVDGAIAFAARGIHGFGYDPVFLLPDGRTMAEIPPLEKHQISHRGLALQAALPLLQEYIPHDAP